MQFFEAFEIKLEVLRNYAKQWAIKCSFLQQLNLSWNQIRDKAYEELSKAMGIQMQFFATFEFNMEPNKR